MEGMGGRLRLVAYFQDGNVELTNFGELETRYFHYFGEISSLCSVGGMIKHAGLFCLEGEKRRFPAYFLNVSFGQSKRLRRLHVARRNPS